MLSVYRYRTLDMKRTASIIAYDEAEAEEKAIAELGTSRIYLVDVCRVDHRQFLI